MNISRPTFFKMLGAAFFAPVIARVAGAKAQPTPTEIADCIYNNGRIESSDDGIVLVQNGVDSPVLWSEISVPHLPMFWEGDTLWGGTEGKRGSRLCFMEINRGFDGLSDYPVFDVYWVNVVGHGVPQQLRSGSIAVWYRNLHGVQF